MTKRHSETIIHIVAGPTASGKSATALELAKAHDGVIINCDSMQIYNALPILTAQPPPEDKAQAPHELYGVLAPDQSCSAGEWRRMAMPVIEAALKAGKTPIICGGTGLYIKALMEGLSPIPDIPPEIRKTVMDRLQALGAEGFYEEVKARDPEMAARFHPNHSARLLRVWEVLEATGKSLADWQAQDKDGPPAHWRFEVHTIIPERAKLHERINARFDWMIDNGALEEVEVFAAREKAGEIPEDALILRALGYRSLRDYLSGSLGREEATEKAKAETRQYAKRQITWFKNQL